MSRSVLAACILAGALASCSPPPSNAPTEAAPTEPSVQSAPTLPDQPAFVWQSVGGGKVLSDQQPARISLGSDQVFLYYPSTGVTAGQTVQFDFTAKSAAPGALRAVLMRHCGQGSDADSASEVFPLTTEQQNFTVKHTFAQSHKCIRIMFASPEASTSEVTIASWKLTPTVTQ